MSVRKMWSQKEDQILIMLYEERKIVGWSKIAQLFRKQFAIDGVNGKQCRQRYYNKLKIKTRSQNEWDLEDEDKLIRMHNQIGNKWIQISTFFIGRTHNDIKNKFYSIFRWSLRHFNLLAKLYCKRTKELNFKTVQRIVSYHYIDSDISHSSTEFIKYQWSKEIKLKLLKFAHLGLELHSISRSNQQMKNQIKSVFQAIKCFHNPKLAESQANCSFPDSNQAMIQSDISSNIKTDTFPQNDYEVSEIRKEKSPKKQTGKKFMSQISNIDDSMWDQLSSFEYEPRQFLNDYKIEHQDYQQLYQGSSHCFFSF